MFRKIQSILFVWPLVTMSVLLGALLLSSCTDTSMKLNLDRLKTCVKTEDRCLIVLSVATNNISPDSYRWYTEGLRKFDYDFQIIGSDLDWNGWLTRGEAMKSALEVISKSFSSSDLEKKVIVATSDTGDVLVQEGPQQLLSKFDKKLAEIKTKFGSKLNTDDLVIVGGEWSCGSNCESRSHEWFDKLNIDKKDRLFPYAQGGFLMGSVAAAKKYYSYTVEFMKSKINDDQIAMGNYTIDHPENIYIDYQQEIAATMLEHFPGESLPTTSINYTEDVLYEFTNRGIALSTQLQQKIGSSEKVYPSFLHVPNNTRRESVRRFFEKLVDHLKANVWK